MPSNFGMPPGLLPFVLQPLGRPYVLAGRLAEALAVLERGMAQGEWRRSARSSRSSLPFSDAYLAAGRGDEAFRCGEESLKRSRAYAIRNDEPYALLSLGNIHLAATPPGFELAARHYAEALALAAELDMRPLVADCHLALGKFHRRAGDAAQAQEHLTAAAAMYRGMDLRFWQEPAEEELRALVESC